MQTVHISSTPASLSVFDVPDTIFIIEIAINLTIQENNQNVPQTITLGSHSVLAFAQNGSISNGTIAGNMSSIDFKWQKNRLSNVTLTGTWMGSICDELFAYDTTPGIKPTFNDILNNLLLFRKIDLRRNAYFLDWPSASSPIGISEDTEIDGHGATIYLSSNKGNTSTGPSGTAYNSSPLFFLNPAQLKRFVLRNLAFEDNAETISVAGYGEEDLYTEQINYSLFEGLATCRTEFNHVKYDGGGVFLKYVNTQVQSDLLLFKDCDLHTNGHAVEIQCNQQTGGPGVGHMNQAVFDHCSLNNHFSNFDGVLSFTGAGLTQQLKIVGSRLGGYPGNLEVSGVEMVFIDKTVLVNHGLCVQVRTENGEIYPRFYTCTDSQFYLTECQDWDGSFKVMGEKTLLMNNRFILSRELVFANIERLFFYHNRIELPTLTEHVITTNPSVVIGYYGNNLLFCPRPFDEPFCFQVETAFLLPDYEPFATCFKSPNGKYVDYPSFNWMNGFRQMSELENGDITMNLDNDGYAGWGLDTVDLSTTLIHDTVTISLIGKPASGNGSGADLVFCEIGDMVPLNIECSQQSVYTVYLGATTIADIPRAVFGAGSSDVRLDVTITQVNGYLDIFVFVNQELFKKHRTGPCVEYYSPTNLTFSPSDLTKIRLIRFVPGGFILDEPQDLITDMLDE